MLSGKQSKPALLWVMLGIVILSLALTLVWSKSHRHPVSPNAPMHQSK